MGGCRCTYKNCTVRSDGKTHLFHYPVFEKVRCHEWLSRAGRHDFFNLKVSQLKNRCICQHHFADHWFMNENKERLKSKAVPTLDGPYCDSSKFKDPKLPQNMFGLYPSACEVMDDDFILDRKSKYDLVYADFLTNSDTTEPLKYSFKYTKVEEETKRFIDIENVAPTTNNNITKIDYDIENANYIVTKQKSNRKRTKNTKKTQEMLRQVLRLKVEQNSTIVPNTVNVEVPLFPVQQYNTNVNNMVTIPVQQKKSRVRIISDKKITEPEKMICVPVSSASFEVVKPSMILNLPKNRAKSKPNDMISQYNEVKEDPSMLNNLDRSMVNETVERVAAINEKKRFNMRLKDIIAEELNGLEEQGAADRGDTLITHNPKKNINNVRAETETGLSSLSKESNLPNGHAYIVHHLEARIDRMETLLLNKIAQNTEEIVSLQKTLDSQEETISVSNNSTKTKSSDKEHKKRLFLNICKYLSPTLKGLIYEELFMDNYDPNESRTGSAPSKRKKLGDN